MMADARSTKNREQQERLKKVMMSMPNSMEAEQAVLGAVLSDNDVATDVVCNLAPEDFYLPAHRKIFGEILALTKENRPVDIVMLSSAMERKGILEEVGGVSALSELVGSIPSTANCEYYVSILKRTALSRNIIRKCNEIVEHAYTEEDADKVLAVAESLIYGISEGKENSELAHISHTTVDVLNNLVEIYNTKESKSGLKIGVSTLDELTNGFSGGQLIVLAARPGCGKTSFCMNIVGNLVRSAKDKVLAMFNLEMSANELVVRLISNLSGIDSRRLQRGEELPEELNKLWQAAASLNDSNVYIDDTAQITAEQILSKCRRLKAQKGALDLVMIDYLQLMEPSDKSQSKNQQVTEMSRAMKILAKELNVPVVLLSQMSRSIEKREGEDKRPMLSDLRDSGAIEQDADIVMFLTEGDFEVFSSEAAPIYLMVAKHRNGSTADLALKWDKSTMNFTPVLQIIRKSKEEDEAAPKEKKPPVALDPIPQEPAADLPLPAVETDEFYEAEVPASDPDVPPFDPDVETIAEPIPDDPLAMLRSGGIDVTPKTID